MAKGTISKRTVDALKPDAIDTFLWDEELRGFGVKITPAGVRTYVYQYRMGGRGTKTRRKTVGRHGSIAPEQARTIAKTLAFKVHQGIDPIEEEKETQHRSATMNFGSYLETFTDGYLKTEWGDSWPQARRQLEMHVLPHLDGKALPDIAATDINPIFDALRTQAALRRNVWAVLSKLFNWAAKRGDIVASPLATMDPPSTVKRRKRILTPDELIAVWRASFKLDATRGRFVRLLILTLQRRSEVAELPWTELHRAETRWKLPGERAKNEQDHLIPLNEQAMVELEALGWKSRGLAFPSSTGKTPISNFSDIKAALDTAMVPILQELADKRADEIGEERHTVTLTPWRMHDIRRTGTTQMQALGFPIEVTERVINHHEGGEAAGIRAVYNLYEYWPEKVRALDAWGAWLERLVSGADTAPNVVQIASARA
jgi:integrase